MAKKISVLFPVFDSPRNTESVFKYDIKHIDELEKMA